MTYDEQITYLTDNPDKIMEEWENGKGLFKRIGINNRSGCLTEIRRAAGKNIKHIIKDKDGSRVEYSVVMGAYLHGIFYDHELTEKIQKDGRIPNHPSKITVEMLPFFKEWQVKIDKMQSNG